MHPIAGLIEPRMAELLAMEHYRLHVIERWPTGANKDAALAGIRSALAGLLRASSGDTTRWICIVCGSQVTEYADGAALAAAA